MSHKEGSPNFDDSSKRDSFIKDTLIGFLAHSWNCDSVSNIISNIEVHIIDHEECYRFTSADGNFLPDVRGRMFAKIWVFIFPCDLIVVHEKSHPRSLWVHEK